MAQARKIAADGISKGNAQYREWRTSFPGQLEKHPQERHKQFFKEMLDEMEADYKRSFKEYCDFEGMEKKRWLNEILIALYKREKEMNLPTDSEMIDAIADRVKRYRCIAHLEERLTPYIHRTKAKLKGIEIVTNFIKTLNRNQYRKQAKGNLKYGWYGFEERYQKYLNDISVAGFSGANDRLKEENERMEKMIEPHQKRYRQGKESIKRQLYIDSENKEDVQPEEEFENLPNPYEYPLVTARIYYKPIIEFNEWLMSLPADEASSKNLAKLGMEEMQPPMFNGDSKKTKEQQAPTQILALVLWYQFEAGLLPELNGKKKAIEDWGNLQREGCGTNLYIQQRKLRYPNNRNPEYIKEAIKKLKHAPEAYELAKQDLAQKEKESNEGKK